AEEGRELVNRAWICDWSGTQPVLGAWLGEKAAVIRFKFVEGSGLGWCERERIRARIVPICFEIRDGLGAGAVGAEAAIPTVHDEGRAMQVVGGEIGPQISAVAKDGTILHQAIAQERLLAGDNVGAREQDASGGIGDLSRNRGLASVCAVSQQPQHYKP